MASHVFISYSRKDKAVVGKFVEALRKQDFIVWQDVSNISAGEDWREAIYKAIDDSAVFLIFWSQAASLSNVVGEEIDRALAQNIPIIPIWLEKGTPLRADLNDKDAVISRSYTSKLTDALLKVAPRIQRQVSDFNHNIPMNLQTVAGTQRQLIGGKEYMIAPLVQSAYSTAIVIAEAGAIVGQSKRVQLMVQCTGDVGYDMVKQAFSAILAEDAEYPDDSEPLVGIYVTGPKDPANPTKYMVDIKNVAHYSDINDTIQKAIYTFTKDDRDKVFQLFLQTLVDIAFVFGVEVSRWVKFQLYRLERGVGYTRIMDISERLP
ncbi:MAG: toll/interleukin-1 receptor domain-containing protein [bacterium]|nr:toll/interleukin-1 receptor domain-containing protein [bacterium]